VILADRSPSPLPAPAVAGPPGFARYTLLVSAVTVGVILWGAYVRASGSGAGCGSSWPVCNGEVIPRSPSVQTVIEFTHRATSGLDFLLVLGQLGWAWRAFPAGSPVRRGAAASMVLMITEALVGAALVLLKLVAGNVSLARAGWAALHLSNTFLLLAALSLTAFWAHGGPAVRLRQQGAVLLLGAIALGGALVLGSSGAITALGDTLFPAASLADGMRQDLDASSHFLIKLRVLHPVIGLGLGAYVLYVGGALAARRPDPLVRRLAAVSAALFSAQVALGFLNLALLAPIPLQIGHLLMADLVWISLVLLVAATLGDRPSPA
jgi:heme A synthase